MIRLVQKQRVNRIVNLHDPDLEEIKKALKQRGTKRSKLILFQLENNVKERPTRPERNDNGIFTEIENGHVHHGFD